MRPGALAPAFILLLAAASASAQTVTLAGTIVAELDSRPLANVRVTLEPTPENRLSPVVLTDAFGRFVIDAEPAPSHRLIARKAGFATARGVAVAEAEITLQMRLGAAIEGRLIDEVGEPVVGAEIAAEPRGGGGTRAVTESDDRGEFRLPVDPAQPFVVVATTIGMAPSDVSVSNGTIVINAAPRFRTYYPAAMTPEAAAALSLRPGEQRGGIDFVIPIGRSGRQPTSAAAALPFSTMRSMCDVLADAPSFGAVSGRIIDSAGLPLPNAQVIVVTDRTGASRQMMRSDGGGRFAFARVEAGLLRLVASKPGYATNEARFELDAERSRDDIELTLPRWGAVGGRVLDDFGEPVRGARVQLLRVRREGGRRRLVPAGESGPLTNDLGAFRLYGLDPGQYMLSAQVGEVGTSEMPGYVRSYYPGSVGAADGQVVTVERGSELLGVDVTLVRSPTFTIRGRILDSAGASTTGGSLNLWPAPAPGGVVGLPAGGRIDDDGRFEFRNVAPGQYSLQAYRGKSQPSVEGEFGVLRLAVTDGDIADAVLRMSRGSDVSGGVVFEVASRQAPRAGIEIAAVPADAELSPPNWALAGLGPDWRFSLSGITGPRRILATQVPDGWMVKAVRANGIDVTDRPIPFGTAGDSVVDVEIVLTDQVSELAGRLVDGRGRAVPGMPLALFSFARDTWYPYSRFVRRVVTGPDGRFSVRGLPADSYYVAEIPGEVLLENAWEEPAVLERLAASGTLVTVGDGQQATVTLRR